MATSRSRRIDSDQLALLPDAILRAAVKAANESIMITEPVLEKPGPRILYVNPAFTRMTGYTAAEAIGRTPRLLQGPKTDRQVLERLKRLVSQGKPFEGETVNYKKSGEAFIIRWYVVPLLDDRDRVTHLLGVQRDVTAERHAHRSAKRLEAAVESLQDVVFIVRRDLSVRYVNPAMASLLGKSSQEVVGQRLSCLSFLQPLAGGSTLQNVLMSLAPDEPWRGDLEIVGHDGRRTTLACTVASVRLKGRDASYVVVGRDITQQRRVEAVASALNMTEHTGYIFAGIRHELGNPVNSLKAALTVMRNHMDVYSPDKLKDYCDKMFEEVTRMEYLLSTLKSVSPHATTFSMEAVHIASFVERFVPLIERDLAERGIQLSVSVTEPEARIWGHPRDLHQVLLNLIHNAVDAVSEAERPHIKLMVSGYGREIEIAVIDNGCGMTAEQQSRLFQPFQSNKSKGTGLGLIITRRLVAQMNGTLSIISHVGSGTRATTSFERIQA